MFKHILVPIDGSKLSFKALDMAAQLAAGGRQGGSPWRAGRQTTAHLSCLPPPTAIVKKPRRRSLLHARTPVRMSSCHGRLR